MSRPTCVGNGYLRDKDLVGINVRLGNTFAQSRYFADLLEENNLSRLVSINTYTGGIIPTILLTGKTIAKDLQYLLAILSERVSIKVLLSKQSTDGVCHSSYIVTSRDYTGMLKELNI